MLIAAVRKITGWPQHRKKMCDRISYRQLMQLTGINSSETISRAVRKLCAHGLFKRLDVNGQGQLIKIIRFVPKPGQQDFFGTTLSESTSKSEEHSPQKSKRCSSKSEDTKQIEKPIKKYTHIGTPLKNLLKKQTTFDFTEPKQVVNHLREIASTNDETSDAAGISIMMLEQLWKWHEEKNRANEELMKSWQWLFYAAAMWPTAVTAAWSEIKDRKLRGEAMKKPGAILTLKIKELTNGNHKHPNEQR